MTPQERELILSVAQRLRTTQLSDRDAEAEQLIRSEIGPQRDALYLLTQAVIVQEQGLRHAQERIQQLEQDLQTARTGAGAPAPRSFLGGLFGTNPPAPTAAPPQAAAPPPATPYAAAPAGPSAAGSFLRTAAAAAAGVVGAQLISDGLHHMFGGAGSGFSGPGSFPLGGAGVSVPGWSDTTSSGRRSSARDVEPQDTDAPGAGGDFDTDNTGSTGQDTNYEGTGGDFNDDTDAGADDEAGQDDADQDEEAADDESDDSGGGNF